MAIQNNKNSIVVLCVVLAAIIVFVLHSIILNILAYDTMTIVAVLKQLPDGLDFSALDGVSFSKIAHYCGELLTYVF